MQSVKQELNLFVSSKKSDDLYFFGANWLLLIVIDRYIRQKNIVDIVLHVSKNSHGNWNLKVPGQPRDILVIEGS